MRNEDVMVRLKGIRKFYEMGSVWALGGIDLEIRKGEFVAVMGPSGCGKSTLLHIIGGVDRATDGRVTVGGTDLGELNDDGLSDFRRSAVGIIFQSFNLLPTLNAIDNVLVPVMPFGPVDDGFKEEAKGLLTRFGLGDRLNNRPGQLSGGQNQRVAIARALINKPGLILADEPTGELDSRTGHDIMSLLKELNRKDGVTVMVVTHDADVAAFADRKIRLRDGRIV